MHNNIALNSSQLLSLSISLPVPPDSDDDISIDFADDTNIAQQDTNCGDYTHRQIDGTETVGSYVANTFHQNWSEEITGMPMSLLEREVQQYRSLLTVRQLQVSELYSHLQEYTQKYNIEYDATIKSLHTQVRQTCIERDETTCRYTDSLAEIEILTRQLKGANIMIKELKDKLLDSENENTKLKEFEVERDRHAQEIERLKYVNEELEVELYDVRGAVSNLGELQRQSSGVPLLDNSVLLGGGNPLIRPMKNNLLDEQYAMTYTRLNDKHKADMEININIIEDQRAMIEALESELLKAKQPRHSGDDSLPMIDTFRNSNAELQQNDIPFYDDNPIRCSKSFIQASGINESELTDHNKNVGALPLQWQSVRYHNYNELEVCPGNSESDILDIREHEQKLQPLLLDHKHVVQMYKELLGEQSEKLNETNGRVNELYDKNTNLMNENTRLLKELHCQHNILMLERGRRDSSQRMLSQSSVRQLVDVLALSTNSVYKHSENDMSIEGNPNDVPSFNDVMYSDDENVGMTDNNDRQHEDNIQDTTMWCKPPTDDILSLGIGSQVKRRHTIDIGAVEVDIVEQKLSSIVSSDVSSHCSGEIPRRLDATWKVHRLDEECSSSCDAVHRLDEDYKCSSSCDAVHRLDEECSSSCDASRSIVMSNFPENEMRKRIKKQFSLCTVACTEVIPLGWRNKKLSVSPRMCNGWVQTSFCEEADFLCLSKFACVGNVGSAGMSLITSDLPDLKVDQTHLEYNTRQQSLPSYGKFDEFVTPPRKHLYRDASRNDQTNLLVESNGELPAGGTYNSIVSSKTDVDELQNYNRNIDIDDSIGNDTACKSLIIDEEKETRTLQIEQGGRGVRNTREQSSDVVSNMENHNIDDVHVTNINTNEKCQERSDRDVYGSQRKQKNNNLMSGQQVDHVLENHENDSIAVCICETHPDNDMENSKTVCKTVENLKDKSKLIERAVTVGESSQITNSSSIIDVECFRSVDENVNKCGRVDIGISQRSSQTDGNDRSQYRLSIIPKPENTRKIEHEMRSRSNEDVKSNTDQILYANHNSSIQSDTRRSSNSKIDISAVSPTSYKYNVRQRNRHKGRRNSLFVTRYGDYQRRRRRVMDSGNKLNNNASSQCKIDSVIPDKCIGSSATTHPNHCYQSAYVQDKGVKIMKNNKKQRSACHPRLYSSSLERKCEEDDNNSDDWSRVTTGNNGVYDSDKSDVLLMSSYDKLRRERRDRIPRPFSLSRMSLNSDSTDSVGSAVKQSQRVDISLAAPFQSSRGNPFEKTRGRCHTAGPSLAVTRHRRRASSVSQMMFSASSSKDKNDATEVALSDSSYSTDEQSNKWRRKTHSVKNVIPRTGNDRQKIKGSGNLVQLETRLRQLTGLASTDDNGRYSGYNDANEKHKLQQKKKDPQKNSDISRDAIWRVLGEGSIVSCRDAPKKIYQKKVIQNNESGKKNEDVEIFIELLKAAREEKKGNLR